MTGQEPPGFAGALLRIEAKVKFISYEPMLAPAVTLPESYGRSLQIAGINWIIIGAQTKPTKQPDIRWVHDLLVAAHNAGNIPVFEKDSLRPLLQAEWQREPWQEMPELINEEVTK
jgi:protein gp37